MIRRPGRAGRGPAGSATGGIDRDGSGDFVDACFRPGWPVRGGLSGESMPGHDPHGRRSRMEQVAWGFSSFSCPPATWPAGSRASQGLRHRPGPDPRAAQRRVPQRPDDLLPRDDRERAAVRPLADRRVRHADRGHGHAGRTVRALCAGPRAGPGQAQRRAQPDGRLGPDGPADLARASARPLAEARQGVHQGGHGQRRAGGLPDGGPGQPGSVEPGGRPAHRGLPRPRSSRTGWRPRASSPPTSAAC